MRESTVAKKKALTARVKIPTAIRMPRATLSCLPRAD
jgi:hypothetical protein